MILPVRGAIAATSDVDVADEDEMGQKVKNTSGICGHTKRWNEPKRTKTS